MTAVIAKLKPNAFSASSADKKAPAAVSVAAAGSTNSDLTENSVKLKAEQPETVNSESTSVKRPAEENEPDQERIPEPQAKKVKTDNDTTEEVKTSETETKTEPDVV